VPNGLPIPPEEIPHIFLHDMNRVAAEATRAAILWSAVVSDQRHQQNRRPSPPIFARRQRHHHRRHDSQSELQGNGALYYYATFGASPLPR